VTSPSNKALEQTRGALARGEAPLAAQRQCYVDVQEADVKLFGWGKRKRFVSQDAHARSLKNQLAMTPKTLAELERHGMAPGAELPLEYFFYSTNRERAESLAKDLVARGYSAIAKPSAQARDIFVITGWTSRMLMDEGTVLEWTRQMATLGFEHDCDFDGWGTNPKGAVQGPRWLGVRGPCSLCCSTDLR
jgi:hypothetical protein